MRIVVIEDHKLFREFIRKLVRDVFGNDPDGEAEDAATGLALCRRIRPELLVLDLELPDRDGLELMDEIQALGPVRTLVVSSQCDEYSVARVFESGVEGFVDKNSQSIEILRDALRAVSAGRGYYSEVVLQLRAAMRRNPDCFTKILSPKEQRLLMLFGSGFSNDEVSRRSGLKVSTVQGHRRNIMAKLSLHSTPELMRYAVSRGFSRLSGFRSGPVSPAAGD